MARSAGQALRRGQDQKKANKDRKGGRSPPFLKFLAWRQLLRALEERMRRMRLIPALARRPVSDSLGPNTGFWPFR